MLHKAGKGGKHRARAQDRHDAVPRLLAMIEPPTIPVQRPGADVHHQPLSDWMPFEPEL
jgi:hypothetical protein